MKTDYQKYKYSVKEIVRLCLCCVGICAILDYVFYKSILLMVLAVPITFIFLRQKKKSLIKERKKILDYQFKDALGALSVAVSAGYSIENAVSQAASDMARLYPENSDIVKEFRYMEIQMKNGVPVEELFHNLAVRTNIEDIENFSAVFLTAKRSGGDLNHIITQVARMLGDKIDVKKEIESTLAAKKAEQMIMSLMPVGIILYLQLTSPDFLSILYGNAVGAAAMSICLGIYLFAYWLGQRIVDIEV